MKNKVFFAIKKNCIVKKYSSHFYANIISKPTSMPPMAVVTIKVSSTPIVYLFI